MIEFFVGYFGLVCLVIFINWTCKVFTGGCTCGVYAYDDDENSPIRKCSVHGKIDWRSEISKDE